TDERVDSIITCAPSSITRGEVRRNGGYKLPQLVGRGDLVPGLFDLGPGISQILVTFFHVDPRDQSVTIEPLRLIILLFKLLNFTLVESHKVGNRFLVIAGRVVGFVI